MDKAAEKPYKERVLEVSGEQFLEPALNITDTIAYEKRFGLTAWIATASYCCIWYINYGKYHPGDKTPDLFRRSHLRQNNVSFVQIFSSLNRSELRLVDIIAIKAVKIRRILVEERSYMWPTVPSIYFLILGLAVTFSKYFSEGREHMFIT